VEGVEKISPICHIYKAKIPETDWEQTPTSVKGRMEEMKVLCYNPVVKMNSNERPLYGTR